MSLRTTLLNNYQTELKVANNMKRSGHTELDSDTWDFTKEYDEGSLIPIDEVITELENRIGLLSDESCTEEKVEELNY